MPFSALLDGKPVIAVLMDDEQWAQAKSVRKEEEDRLLVGYTRLPGFARTSALGLRHFAHRKGYAPDYEWSESAEHLALKAELVKAIANHGWEVDTEVPSGPERSWIADVLAWRSDRRIAFEVQWSKQSAAEYVRRTERYAAEGIECVWFARHMPNLAKPDITPELAEAFRKVPVFPLQGTEHLSELIATKDLSYPKAMIASVPAINRGVSLGRRVLPVAELAAAVLDEKIQVRRTFAVIIYEAKCTRCRKPALYWHSQGVSRRIPFQRPEQDPLIIAGAQRAGQILDPSLTYAHLQAKNAGAASSSTPEFACPHCKAFQKRSLEPANLVAASRRGRGLRFEVPVEPRWDDYLGRWGVRPQAEAKLSVAL